MSDETIIDIAGAKQLLPGNVERKLVMGLWGTSGCGKTVLASTAPGKKLWIQFDTQGTAALGKDDNVITVDFSKYSHEKVVDFEEGALVERDLLRILKARPDIGTLVVDSVTAISALCLTHAVLSGKASGAKFKATIEQPGMAGYGIRNRITLGIVRMFLRVAAMADCHLVLIMHEDAPAKDTDGNIISITVLLGGTLPTEVPLQISEMWYLEDDGRKRTIFLRPFNKRAPMRTRMFRTSKQSFFTVPYDLETRTGDGIAQWYERWKQSGFDLIEPPKQ